MGPDAMILVFWMLSFKPTFSLSSFTFIKRPLGIHKAKLFNWSFSENFKSQEQCLSDKIYQQESRTKHDKLVETPALPTGLSKLPDSSTMLSVGSERQEAEQSSPAPRRNGAPECCSAWNSNCTRLWHFPSSSHTTLHQVSNLTRSFCSSIKKELFWLLL